MVIIRLVLESLTFTGSLGCFLDHLEWFFIIFRLFEKKVSFWLTDSLQGVNMKVVLLYKKSMKISLLQPLNSIGLSYDNLIIINRCFWVRRIFFIYITYPRNKMKVIWCSKRSPCRFLQKALFQGWSWHGLCPKSFLKAQVPHFSTSDALLFIFVTCEVQTK